MSDTVRILSIDGGGVRGVIPAVLLAELERRTGLPTARLFDLIAGTSTGGILGLALSMPGPDGKPRYSAAELAGLYELNGSKIFSRSIWRRLAWMGTMRESKYPTEGIENVLKCYFGDAKLSQALTSVLVPSYEIERRTPFFFRTHLAAKSSAYDFPMWQAARATSAAPTYFEPFRIENGSDYYALIDGGVYANNPALCALVEARVMFPKAKNFLVLSLGTGILRRRLPFSRARRWGVANWAKPIFNIVLESVSDIVDYQLHQLLPVVDFVKSYYRFQPSLFGSEHGLDHASRSNLRDLRMLAESMVRDRADDLDALAHSLLP